MVLVTADDVTPQPPFDRDYPQRLSKLLWDAREGLEMYADGLDAKFPGAGRWPRKTVADIDDYRAERGWSPDGFGGET